jgi:oxygen-dependent protoporphyrinogen oxidase
MVDSECHYRSLIRGALATRTAYKKGVSPTPLFTAMRDGMQRMVEALARQVPRESLRSSRRVESLQARESGWRLTSGGATEDFDQVVLALPAHGSAHLLAGVPDAARLVEILKEFSYTSAVTVALGYKISEIALPPGFGFLVPRSESKRMMACTLVHNKFENRAPEGTALLRIFLGGARDDEVLDLSENEIVEIVRRELREVLNLAAEPLFAKVFKWRKAMAQYEVGHLLRIARLEMHVQRFPGLHLTGNAYHGLGIPDCVRRGRSAADAIMRRMRSQRASS